jgi:hypothetical protein
MSAKTQELIKELEKGGFLPVSVIKGRTGGTYVCRELAIDYAQWVDEEGRFCLNDLHKAAGNKKGDYPSVWLGNKKTQEFIKAINGTSFQVPVEAVKVINGGDTSVQGVYACKELVYHYATWISAEF